ncbi:MAG: hypothetical protein K0S76_1983 [Herbinix sp.]|jgi:hypothetical protein|nr:hypothetical protein [Herbinix sp.]
MRIKTKVITVVTVLFFSLLVIATFFSKTIYYYTHKKVTAVTVSNGFIINEFHNINGGPIMDGDDNIIFPVKLTEPLVVKKIMVEKLDYVNENDAIIVFDSDSVKIARSYILADLEECKRNIPVNVAELAALNQQLSIFDSCIDENGILHSGKSGFITEIYLTEGDDFMGAGQTYSITNKETNYLIGLNFDLEKESYLDDKCEVTLQSDDVMIRGVIHKIVTYEKDCLVMVKPNIPLTDEDIRKLFADSAVLLMDVKTSSGRYDIIVPAEAIIDHQYIYNTITIENFLGSRTIAEKIDIKILDTNGEFVAIDAKYQKIMMDSKVITNKPKLVNGEEVVLLYQ